MVRHLAHGLPQPKKHSRRLDANQLVSPHAVRSARHGGRLKLAYRTVRTVMDAVDPRHPFYYKGGEVRPYCNVTFKKRKTIIDAAYVLVTAVEAVCDEVVPSVARTALVAARLPEANTSVNRISN